MNLQAFFHGFAPLSYIGSLRDHTAFNVYDDHHHHYHDVYSHARYEVPVNSAEANEM